MIAYKSGSLKSNHLSLHLWPQNCGWEIPSLGSVTPLGNEE